MGARENILAEIDAYLGRTGMAAWALGQAACQNVQAIYRLRRGANTGLRLVETIESFMIAHPGGVRVPRPGPKSTDKS